MRLVLDASVVLKWYVPESDSTIALALRDWIHARARQVVAPRFFYIEAASILWKKQVLRHELSPELARQMLDEIRHLTLHVVEDQFLLAQAYAIAGHYLITPYDALYIAAAVEENCPLVTADEALIRKLKNHPHADSLMKLSDWKKLQSPQECSSK